MFYRTFLPSEITNFIVHRCYRKKFTYLMLTYKTRDLSASPHCIFLSRQSAAWDTSTARAAFSAKALRLCNVHCKPPQHADT